MSVHVSQHPLVRHKQTQLRDIKTDPAAFRALVASWPNFCSSKLPAICESNRPGCRRAHQLFRRTRGRDGWTFAHLAGRIGHGLSGV